MSGAPEPILYEEPERIWAKAGMPGYTCECHPGVYDVEYIRADLSPQWQPIETAPKDGTWILIWLDWIGHPMSSAFDNGSWQNLPWVANSKLYNPTHWMPLPKPPTE